MAEFPALPLFTDAYLGDTTHLTTFEHGAYLLLLFASWRSPGCCLPDDDALLARYSRTTRDKWLKVRPILSQFFRISDGLWHQARLQDEFQLLQSRRDQQRAAGNASAAAKALKRKKRGSTDVGKPLQRNVNETSTPTPTPTPTPTVISDANASSPALQPEHVVEAWNEMACRRGLPSVRKLTPERRRKLISRIRQHPLEDWTEAIAAIDRNPWLHGDNGKGWRASFDFLLQPSSFTKLMEGTYDRSDKPANGSGSYAH